MLYLATVLLASILVPPLVSSSSWNDPTSSQYHIQTDEGPERYFRYQTNNGQYRKEKRLQDGTVIGTYAWIDDDGYLRQRDYIADSQGYRILKNKNIFVGRNVNVGDAVKAAKKSPNTYRPPVKLNNYPQVPSRGYVSITPKPIYVTSGLPPSVEVSLNSIPSSTLAPVQLETSSLLPPLVSNSNNFINQYVPPTIKEPVLNTPDTYSSTSTAGSIISTYSPNGAQYISSTPPSNTYLASSQNPIVYISSNDAFNEIYSTTSNTRRVESSTVSPVSSVSYLPPVSSTTYLPPSSQYFNGSTVRNVPIPSRFPLPIASSPRPFQVSSQPSTIYLPTETPSYKFNLINKTSESLDYPRAYTSQPSGINSNSIDNSEQQDRRQDFVNPYIHQNGPTYPIDTKGHSFNPSYNNIGNGYDPQYPYYDGISVTNDGFRYYIPRAYHEEQNTGYDRKSGSFGYVDPFGIRRVIYYNAGPDGFKHRKNNRYVGLNGTPYDPRPY